MILEGIVTTLGPDGTLNVSPMGPRIEDDWRSFELRPFVTSRTFRNLQALGEGVLHVTDDVLLLARAALGAADDTPTRPAEVVRGRILADACRYYEFRVVVPDVADERPSLAALVVAQGRGREFFGLNRAKAAIVEAAILATRAAWLPPAEVLGEFQRLRIPVEKTGGEAEHQAYKLLFDHILAETRSRGFNPDALVP